MNKLWRLCRCFDVPKSFKRGAENETCRGRKMQTLGKSKSAHFIRNTCAFDKVHNVQFLFILLKDCKLYYIFTVKGGVLLFLFVCLFLITWLYLLHSWGGGQNIRNTSSYKAVQCDTVTTTFTLKQRFECQ